MQAGSQSWMVQAIAMNHAKEMSHWASRAARPETSCLVSDPIRPRRRLFHRANCAAPVALPKAAFAAEVVAIGGHAAAVRADPYLAAALIGQIDNLLG